MIPVFLDPAKVRVALVGRDGLAVKRLAWLRGLGAEAAVFSDAPSDVLRAVAGDQLIARLPDAEELSAFAAVWIADLEPEAAEAIARAARLVNVLANVEDVKPLCDFHTPAIVQRGRLLLAAGTGGASPAATALVRERLEYLFPEVWSEAMEELAQARLALREFGAPLSEISLDARTRLGKRGLIAASAQ